MRKVEEIVSLIIREKPSLSIDVVKKMIKEKAKELGELVDEYVIALMVAKELGVAIPKEGESLKVSKLKIRDLIAGLRNVNLTARVVKISKEIIFSRDKKEHRCLRLEIGDSTGVTSLVLWDDQIDYVKGIKIGDVIRISKGYTREYRGRVELYLGSGGSISTTDEEIPPLEYFLDEYDIDCTILRVEKVIRKPNFACIRGSDFKGRRVRILVWDGLEEDLESGEYYVCGLRKKFSSRDFIEFYANRGRAVFTPYEAEIKPIDLPVYTPSSLAVEEARDLTLKGYFLAINPTKFPKVFLGDEKKVLSIVLTYDELLSSVASLEPGTEVLVGGVDVIKGGIGKIVKVGRCGYLEAVNPENLLSTRSFPEKYIIEGEGACTLYGSVISLDFNFKLVEVNGEERVMSFSSILIDDGTGQARVYSSSVDVIENLLNMSQEEVTEYLETGVLNKIINYIKNDILGNNFRFKSLVYKREGKPPLAIALSISKERDEL